MFFTESIRGPSDRREMLHSLLGIAVGEWGQRGGPSACCGHAQKVALIRLQHFLLNTWATAGDV